MTKHFSILPSHNLMMKVYNEIPKSWSKTSVQLSQIPDFLNT